MHVHDTLVHVVLSGTDRQYHDNTEDDATGRLRHEFKILYKLIDAHTAIAVIQYTDCV